MAALLLAKEIRKEINLGSTKIKKIGDRCRNENDENIQELKQGLDNTGEKVNALIEVLIKDGQEREDLQKRVKTLEIEVAALKEKINKLEEERSLLLARQLAYHFEENLARYIYPLNMRYPTTRKFTYLQEWLGKYRGKPEGKTPNENWEEFRKKFKWSPYHEEMFYRSITIGMYVAHPHIDWEKEKIDIPDTFTPKEKDCLQDFFQMIKYLNNAILEKKF